MLFTQPVDFREALQARAVKSALLNNLSSQELAQFDPALLERAKFSAGVMRLDIIDRFDALATAIVAPRQMDRVMPEGNIQTVTHGMDYATARLEMKQLLDSIRYRPQEGKAGTIQDLRSNPRLNLILKMNTQQVQNYGGWAQGQNAAVLSAWPASELYRAERRHEPRNWPVRWLNAAGEVGDDAAARALRKYGQMVARNDSKIWEHLGPFKLPYAPFDWNSGMDRRDKKRSDAIALGIIEPGDVVRPQTRGLNDLLQASPNVRSAELRKALLEDLGDTFEFEGDVLKRKGQPLIGPEDSPIEPLPQIPRIEQKVAKSAKETKPVSAALQIVRRNPRPLEDFKTLIDQIHDDGVLPPIKVDGQPPENSNGVFRRSNNVPESIGVRSRRGDVFTFGHEIGHFIDHQALGERGQYASELHADLQAFRDAARSSANLQALQEALKENPRLEYFLRPREVWARAYAQWLAEKILGRELGSAEMREAITRELESRLAMPHQVGHWTAEDFKAISAAIDALFQKKGWLK
jgi:hypothetical protein